MNKIICIIIIAVWLQDSALCQSFKKLKSTVSPFGINLAGAEFGQLPGVYKKDYDYPTKQDIKFVKAQGFRLIRIPFLWERLQPVLSAELDSGELNRLVQVVNLAKKQGVMVLLDMHNYCRRTIAGKPVLINTREVSINDVADVWKKLAVVFKNKKNMWGYGLMNEPHDMPAADSWFNIAQAIITQIRTVDTRNNIVIGGNQWSSATLWPVISDQLKNLHDPSGKLIFEAHIYFDADGSGTYKGDYETEKATPEIGVKRAEPFITWLQQNHLHGFVGEYGIPDTDGRWLVTLNNLLHYLQQNHVNGCYWAAGHIWGNYTLSVQPRNNGARPQMTVLEKYIYARR